MYKKINDHNKKQFKNKFNIKFMKVVKVYAFILVLVLLPSFIISCSRNSQNVNNIKDKFPYPIDVTNIKSITRFNVSPAADNKYAVLEPGKDKDKIDKIFKLINSGSKVRVSTEEDLKAFRGKGPYPTTLKIINKDDSYFIIMPAYSVTQIKLNDSIGIAKTPLKDRFILEYFKAENIDKFESYTIFSSEVGNYLLNTTKELENDF